MTDKEKLIDMLKRAGIIYTIEFNGKNNTECIVVGRGYVGFSTWFYFTKDNAIENIQAYEE